MGLTPGFQFLAVRDFFSLQLHPDWLWGYLEGGGVCNPGGKADHSPPSSAEIKNAWSYTSTPLVCLQGMVLCQAHGLLYFNLLPSLSNLYQVIH